MQKQEGKILIIDDDQQVLYTARMVLKNYFTTVKTESFPSQIRELLSKDSYDVIVLDMNFAYGVTSGKEGLQWLKVIKELDPEANVVMSTAYGDIELAVVAMKEGATDFLVKPWDKEKLLATVSTVFQLSQSRKEVKQLQSRQKGISQALDTDSPPMLSESPAMRSVLQTIEKVAPTDANVLILGENGTGKDLVARAIHRQSLRADAAFVKVDLGAISPTLFESELFGHVKGAFTDAREDRLGRFEIATSGSLFLDEIGNLPLPLQSKLLTVLQSRQLVRVGSNKPVSIDIRLICATNQSLREMVAEHSFRQDLLYRINTVEITLPPLRQRIEDIPLLVEHFLQAFTHKYQKKGLVLAKDTVRQLQQYPWPGNIRELEHATERAVILSDGSPLRPSDFLGESNRNTASTRVPDNFNLEEMEKQAIAEAIRKHHGNLTKAALELGFGRSTLYRKMNRYGLLP